MKLKRLFGMGLLLAGLTANTALACDVPDGAVESLDKLTYPIGTKVEAPRFVGDVFLKPIVPRENEGNLSAMNLVTFGPGSYSKYHRHGAMTVVVEEGIGIYQVLGEKAQVLRRGDVLHIPAGIPHFHGAVKDSAFSQFVIWDSAWQAPEGLPKLPDDVDYDNLEFAE